MNKQHNFLYPLEPLFGHVLSPFEHFLRRTTAGGIILIGTTLLTLLITNSPWGGRFPSLLGAVHGAFHWSMGTQAKPASLGK
jgi:NhaA family Na+:H+ antiporter